ncbi:hypothetical protein WK32_17320 [Burkholderia vietnamiensis]|nr:hypothetical protein WK28_23065 [Burkholderia vietnamiensis]KVS01616.1 hypothetical protein WK32_17320 [Burkholderia vietnamiensis]
MVQRVEHMSAIDHSGAGIEIDGDTKCFCNFFLRHTELVGFCRVKSDAAVAACCDSDCQRNQLSRLCVEMICLGAGGTEQTNAFERVRGVPCEFMHATGDGADCFSPVFHGFLQITTN